MSRLPAKILRRLRNRPLRRVTVDLSKALSRKNLYEFLDAQYSQIPRGSIVLNVGSGGKISDLLHAYAIRNDFRVLSMDIDPARGPDLVGDISNAPCPCASVDVVVLSEVLEHVQVPQAAIQNIHRLLKPGGRLILTVPFLFPIHDQPHDYYRYTRFGLEYLLQAFQAVEVRERNSWAEAINVLAPRLFTQAGENAQRLALLLSIQAALNLPLVLLFAKLAPTNFMTTGYVVTARK